MFGKNRLFRGPGLLTIHFLLSRKFGKQIQKRQLEVPEYAASFVNYKALKKVGAPWTVSPLVFLQMASRPLLSEATPVGHIALTNLPQLSLPIVTHSNDN